MIGVLISPTQNKLLWGTVANCSRQSAALSTSASSSWRSLEHQLRLITIPSAIDRRLHLLSSGFGRT
jgi:hypothetical protein